MISSSCGRRVAWNLITPPIRFSWLLRGGGGPISHVCYAVVVVLFCCLRCVVFSSLCRSPPSHIIAHPHVCIATHIKSQRDLSFYKVSFCIMFLQQLATSNIHNSEAVTPISDETGTGRNKPQRDLSFQRLPSASSPYNNLQPRIFIT